MATITVAGTGYVGLVSGACLADFGNTVICVDNNAAKIETLKKGGIPIYEPGLDEVVNRNVQAGRLNFCTDMASSVKKIRRRLHRGRHASRRRRKRRPEIRRGRRPRGRPRDERVQSHRR